MIERLNQKDINEAAKVNQLGKAMQIPSENQSIKKCLDQLERFSTFVYKKNGEIRGLLIFTFKTEFTIDMIFICSLDLRQGIASKLMKKLVAYGVKNKVTVIYSNVSSEDKRTMNFYKSCGFKRFGKPYEITGTIIYKTKATPKRIISVLSSE